MYSRRARPALTPNELQELRGLIPAAHSGQTYLVTGSSALIGGVGLELAQQLAVRGELRLLLGGNRFSVERLPLILGDQVHHIYEVLERLWVSRGETCYQLLHALQKTTSDPTPLLLTDMLSTFYEVELSEAEVQRVLADCIRELDRICQSAPVLVTAAIREERPQLLTMLKEGVSQRVELHPALDSLSASQPPLLPAA